MPQDRTPHPHEKVEILIDGQWIPATFHPSDFVWTGQEEIWWYDYFSTETETYPDDTQSGDDLPEWRRPETTKFPSAGKG